MRLRQLRQHQWVLGIIGLIFTFFFQNCGSGGFQVQQAPQESLQLGSSQPPDSSNSTPTPTPQMTATPVPTMTPTATPPPAALKKTRFYYGRSKGIDVLELDHSTGQMSILGSTNYTGNTVGWLTYEKNTNTVLAADSEGSVLQVYNHNAANGALASKVSFNNYGAQIVHLTVLPTTTGYSLFGSSYNRGRIDHHTLNTGMSQLASSQSLLIGNNALTHSSSFDSKRSLLYVASLGANKVDVFKYSEQTGLTALTSFAVASPRTVVYDSTFDKVFIATETQSGNSFIRIYSITAAGASYTFSDVGSLAMPYWGGDLKINHAYHYVMATAREPGKESIYGLPITAAGLPDSTRQALIISVGKSLPRALEITEDGLYAVVGMNSTDAENVAAYKMTFNAQMGFISSQRIFQQKIDNSSGYLCGLSIPVR